MKKRTNMEEGNYIALAKEACPCCGKEMDGPLLLAKNLNTDIKSKVHGKVIDIADHLCDECQAGVNMGAVMVCVIDEDKSGKNIKEIFRCGIVNGIKREAFDRMMQAIDQPTANWLRQFEAQHHFIFMDYRAAEEFGLPVDSYLEYLKSH